MHLTSWGSAHTVHTCRDILSLLFSTQVPCQISARCSGLRQALSNCLCETESLLGGWKGWNWHNMFEAFWHILTLRCSYIDIALSVAFARISRNSGRLSDIEKSNPVLQGLLAHWSSKPAIYQGSHQYWRLLDSQKCSLFKSSSHSWLAGSPVPVDGRV